MKKIIIIFSLIFLYITNVSAGVVPGTYVEPGPCPNGYLDLGVTIQGNQTIRKCESSTMPQVGTFTPNKSPYSVGEELTCTLKGFDYDSMSATLNGTPVDINSLCGGGSPETSCTFPCTKTQNVVDNTTFTLIKGGTTLYANGYSSCTTGNNDCSYKGIFTNEVKKNIIYIRGTINLDNSPPTVTINLNNVFQNDTTKWCNIRKYRGEWGGDYKAEANPGCEFYKSKNTLISGTDDLLKGLEITILKDDSGIGQPVEIQLGTCSGTYTPNPNQTNIIKSNTLINLFKKNRLDECLQEGKNSLSVFVKDMAVSETDGKSPAPNKKTYTFGTINIDNSNAILDKSGDLTDTSDIWKNYTLKGNIQAGESYSGGKLNDCGNLITGSGQCNLNKSGGRIYISPFGVDPNTGKFTNFKCGDLGPFPDTSECEVGCPTGKIWNGTNCINESTTCKATVGGSLVVIENGVNGVVTGTTCMAYCIPGHSLGCVVKGINITPTLTYYKECKVLNKTATRDYMKNNVDKLDSMCITNFGAEYEWMKFSKAMHCYDKNNNMVMCTNPDSFIHKSIVPWNTLKNAGAPYFKDNNYPSPYNKSIIYRAWSNNLGLTSNSNYRSNSDNSGPDGVFEGTISYPDGSINIFHKAPDGEVNTANYYSPNDGGEAGAVLCCRENTTIPPPSTCPTGMTLEGTECISQIRGKAYFYDAYYDCLNNFGTTKLGETTNNTSYPIWRNNFSGENQVNYRCETGSRSIYTKDVYPPTRYLSEKYDLNLTINDILKNDHEVMNCPGTYDQKAYYYCIKKPNEPSYVQNNSKLIWMLDISKGNSWSIDSYAKEPIWNKTTKKYTYPTGKTSEDYPLFKYCTSFEGWRVPTKEELYSIRSGVKNINGAYSILPNITPNYYVSSNIYGNEPTQSVTIYNFDRNEVGQNGKNGSMHIGICIKDI